MFLQTGIITGRNCLVTQGSDGSGGHSFHARNAYVFGSDLIDIGEEEDSLKPTSMIILAVRYFAHRIPGLNVRPQKSFNVLSTLYKGY